MPQPATEQDLKQFFADVFGLDANQVGEATSMDTVGRWDSSRHLSFVLALEERFDVTLSEQETLEVISYPLTKLVLQEHGVRFGGTAKGVRTQ